MNIISTKQLREDFQFLKDGLEEGEKFLLIYRSQPLATILPIGDDPAILSRMIEKRKKMKTEKLSKLEKDLKTVDRLAGGIKLGKGLTTAKINSMINSQYDEKIAKMLS